MPSNKKGEVRRQGRRDASGWGTGGLGQPCFLQEKEQQELHHTRADKIGGGIAREGTGRSDARREERNACKHGGTRAAGLTENKLETARGSAGRYENEVG